MRLKALRRKAWAYVALLRQANGHRIMALKKQVLESYVLRQVLARVQSNAESEARMSKDSLADHYRQHACKERALLAFKHNWFDNKRAKLL